MLIIDDKTKKLVEIIKDLNENEKVSIFNDYCEKNRYYDDIVCLTEEIDLFWEGKKPSEILKEFEDFSIYDLYYSFNAFGAYSYGEIEENQSWFPEDIAKYIIQNDDDLGCNEIREYLDETNEDE